jgi:hypothetical protein
MDYYVTFEGGRVVKFDCASVEYKVAQKFYDDVHLLMEGESKYHFCGFAEEVTQEELTKLRDETFKIGEVTFLITSYDDLNLFVMAEGSIR